MGDWILGIESCSYQCEIIGQEWGVEKEGELERGGGCTPLFFLYRDVPLDRVWFSEIPVSNRAYNLHVCILTGYLFPGRSPSWAPTGWFVWQFITAPVRVRVSRSCCFLQVFQGSKSDFCIINKLMAKLHEMPTCDTHYHVQFLLAGLGTATNIVALATKTSVTVAKSWIDFTLQSGNATNPSILIIRIYME